MRDRHGRKSLVEQAVANLLTSEGQPTIIMVVRGVTRVGFFTPDNCRLNLLVQVVDLLLSRLPLLRDPPPQQLDLV